jgi:diguanylate cyclase (GGDEF)-like protein
MLEDVCDTDDTMVSTASALPVAPLAEQNAALLSHCLLTMDRIDAACRQRESLEAELHALRHTITGMTIKLAAATADVSRARYQSFHDGLTSLPNRQLFISTLVDVLSKTTPETASIAVLYFDLDGFKSVNDLHGHQFGDQLLKIVGARLLHGIRAADMACRMGGDEFACLLIGAATRNLSAIASKLHRMISATAAIGETEIRIHPSIGIAVYPDDGLTAHELLHSADVAMYAAKQRRVATGTGDAANR